MEFLNKKDIYLKLNTKIKIKISDMLFLFPFFVYLINKSMSTTMFNVYMSNTVTRIINIFLIINVFIKVVIFDRYSINEIIRISILVFTALICFLLTRQIEIINIIILIIGAKDVSFLKIVKIYFYITLSITIIAMISAEIGIIEHIVTQRNGVPRYAFGSIYCTNFAAHIFYLIISYFYINYNKLSVLNSVVFGLLGIFVYIFCGARLDSISIMIVTIFSFYVSLNKNKIFIKNKKLNIINKIVLIYSVLICAIISIVITLLYNPSNTKMVALDRLLSNRLNQGMKGITEYGIKLFGERIIMRGNGGTSESVITNYFFIDSSYLSIALKYGIIMLILLCFYYAIFNKNKIKNGDILLPILILFVAINSLVAHHFIDIAYNPFILVTFALDESYNIKSKNKWCI